MSAFSGRLPLRRCLWFILTAALVSGLFSHPVSAKNPIPGTYQGTVVIDPGHGGHDTGAKGEEGYHEKDLSLTLARLIVERLQTDYRVVLTRNGDYRLDIPSRTAVANHEKASVFVSLHTGGSHPKLAGGLSIFLFKEPPESPGARDSESADTVERAPSNPSGPRLWDTIQLLHQADSLALARTFHSAFQNLDGMTVNPVDGLPLWVLRGADMPAVLIEVGNLIHPREGESLKDTVFLAELADRIKFAIESFIKRNRG